MDEGFETALKLKLENLHTILARITAPDDIHKPVFEGNTEYSQSLLKSIDELIMKAAKEEDNLEKDAESIKTKIFKYSNELSLPNSEIMSVEFQNLHLKIIAFDNELGRINLIREQLKNEIIKIKKEIQRLKEFLIYDKELHLRISDENIEMNDIGMDDIETVYSCFKEDEISYVALEKLKTIYNSLKIQEEKLEAKRQNYYDEIGDIAEVLKILPEFTFQESISELFIKYMKMKTKFKENKQKFDSYLDQIRSMEAILSLDNKVIEVFYDDNTLLELENYKEFLISEQKRLFDEIFESTKNQLYKINEIFGQEKFEYEKNEETLNKMQFLLKDLTAKKDKFIEILDIVETRRLFLIKMTEFEKLASDPRRLFKSSFQLNTEEKFRSNAYPNLLNMEKNLIDKLDSYETEFGPFIYQGDNLKLKITEEIDNRIINRTVFISRCDSPYRKKK